MPSREFRIQPCQEPEIKVDLSEEMQKEINPENSLEILMLKLKLQYFGHLMGRAKSLENTKNTEKD